MENVGKFGPLDRFMAQHWGLLIFFCVPRLIVEARMKGVMPDRSMEMGRDGWRDDCY